MVVGDLYTISELWQLASCIPLVSSVAVGDLYTISEPCGSWQAVYRWQALRRLASSVAAGKLCGSWQAMAVGDLYTVSELCGSWQAVYRWQALWQLATCVAVSKLYPFDRCSRYGGGEAGLTKNLFKNQPRLSNPPPHPNKAS